ncbi:MAG: hypothetical protein JNL06_12430 [Alphaproteobacteria bacterium]|nr:hypothetical protein [Alphaproteobacteria bacterium]
MAKAVRRSLGEGGPSPVTYVYLLTSLAFPNEHYVGHTDDLRTRLLGRTATDPRIDD